MEGEDPFILHRQQMVAGVLAMQGASSNIDQNLPYSWYAKSYRLLMSPASHLVVIVGGVEPIMIS